MNPNMNTTPITFLAARNCYIVPIPYYLSFCSLTFVVLTNIQTCNSEPAPIHPTHLQNNIYLAVVTTKVYI
jgi:hypothetical protein